MCWMVNDLFVDVKDAKGNGAGEYRVVENPPPMFTQQIRNLAAAMGNWPKPCVILGAEGSQWPFTKVVGHATLSAHLG
eukprot:4960103-Alexandrium_andersonii.AAC.1